MLTPDLDTSTFIDFFKGSESGYGVHIYDDTVDGLKHTGKSWTERNLVTQNLYRDHLNGKKGLGIVPLTSEGTCKFTVIDVDVYGVSLFMFTRAIEKFHFPMVPFRSKSGGLHIYTFFETFVNAEEAVSITREFAYILNIDKFVKDTLGTNAHTLEIFPKQERDKDVGSWINLPYYDAMNKPSQCVIRGDEDLSLSDALIHIKEHVTTLEKSRNFLSGLPYNDAPPCLQSLYLLNAVEQNGGRNNYLFSWGAYFKKKDENTFESELFQINEAMTDPLKSEELEDTIIKSLRKKDYNYMCKQMPCQGYCNKKVCKLREYGVGKSGGYFSGLEFGQMFQYRQNKPYYEWDVKQQGDAEYKRLRFKDENEIIKQDVFAQLCFRELHVFPMKLNQLEWCRLVNKTLEDIETVKIDEQSDSSPLMTLKVYFHEFLVERSMAKKPSDIETHRVYHELLRDEYWFRTNDLINFLYAKKSFREYRQQDITAILKDLGCYSKTIRLGAPRNNTIRVYALPNNLFEKNVKSAIVVTEVEEGVEVEEVTDDVVVENTNEEDKEEVATTEDIDDFADYTEDSAKEEDY